jgi:outer membrane protein assembly factor BamB
VSALEADDRRVFVLGRDDRGRRGVWALDKVSGNVMWRKDRELPAAEADGPSSLAVAGDGVCVVSGSMISFFNRRTGDAVWSFHLGTSGMTSVCGTSGGHVYVAGGQVLCALQSVSGQVVWRQSLEGVAPLLARPMIWADESHVVVVRGCALKGGMASARHPRDGRLLWEQPIGAPMSVQVAGGRIYVKSTKLEVLDVQGGQRLWSAPMDGCSPVAWSGEHIYVIGGKKKQNIVSLDAATGHRQWEQRLAGSCSGVVVDGARGYLRGHNGVLYAITIRDRT